ncbi:hypothetical protein M5W83_07105 [Paenibacillus thiaminolyticus]|uniref:Uncharacterized protein n=1 Tax=Paenibacillus thiaminolyticus TaxID=49283 RepID=A0AAP9DUM6_PANTH|nr:hypothetical protein [Paenibacillus thiaminolyticus]MCY9537772.1 hypothetical protein [Paenibacillus thiaminolyticus]MCY9604039.1 hypothetical protein [Paenibacillus thiaminolyticus]MCY9606916.1 hypothetical protein [Paenibacillus thiaminolyticus]MCY9616265.1 hypothetical protein [Paenibacillus thiaminolyticus]MCY9619362.1 hypothetical protein [Paenibacillus thiaminolyticus]
MSNDYSASRKKKNYCETQLKAICKLYQEENRELRQQVDILNLELMKCKGSGSTSRRHFAEKPVQNPKVSHLNISTASYDQFPIILSSESSFFSKVLYPTKKLAYYYAVLGIKGTAKKIGGYLKKKR